MPPLRVPRPVDAAPDPDSAGLGAVRAAAGPPVSFAALGDHIRSVAPRPRPDRRL
ncbi:hypothetical protein AB0G55_19365 [Streptomyces toyocaensis]|uniref:hypothetical protein n=1 Tax=Streptomyces toyocaensis TaxID=55952 RepID=UPI0012FEB5CB|nr:hypothetical protein [Streptomyces toyocaensis]